jgi:hypothetical protein
MGKTIGARYKVQGVRHEAITDGIAQSAEGIEKINKRL